MKPVKPSNAKTMEHMYTTLQPKAVNLHPDLNNPTLDYTNIQIYIVYANIAQVHLRIS